MMIEGGGRQITDFEVVTCSNYIWSLKKEGILFALPDCCDFQDMKGKT